MKASTRGGLAVVAAAACFSTLPVLGKLALGAGAALWPMVAWRFLGGAALAWLLLLPAGARLPHRKGALVLLALGILYGAVGLAFLASLQWIPATTASLVFYTYPAAVLVLAALFLGERITPGRVVSLVLAVTGCALTAGLGGAAGALEGVLLVLLSVAGLSVYITASRHVMEDLPARGSAAVVLTGAALTVAAAALIRGGLAEGPAAAGLALGGGTGAVLWTALMAVVATALPLILFLAGIRRIGAGTASLLATVEPALTAGLAALLLGERLGLLQYLGGALILAGVLRLRMERPLAAGEERPALEA